MLRWWKRSGRAQWGWAAGQPCPPASARTGWGLPSVVVVPGLCPLRGSGRPCCSSSIAKGGNLMGFNKIPVSNRSLGEVYVSACPIDWGPWCILFFSLSQPPVWRMICERQLETWNLLAVSSVNYTLASSCSHPGYVFSPDGPTTLPFWQVVFS